MKTLKVTTCLVCFVILTCLSFPSCGGKQVTGDVDKPITPEEMPPAWFTNPPADDDKYYRATGSSKENEEAAKTTAVAELIMKFAPTKVGSEVRLKTTSTMDGESENITQDYISNSTAFAEQKRLSGYQFPKKDIAGGVYYVLARIPKETLEQHWETMWKEAETAVKQGDTYLESRQVVPALIEYAEALKIVTLLKPDPDKVTPDRIMSKTRDINNDLEISKEDKEPTADYGDSLDDPLVVTILYKGKPLRDFPLKATYTQGTGLLDNKEGQKGTVISFKTDEDGKGSCWVNRIDSISWDNYVQITADVPDSIPLSKAKTGFRYTSKFPQGELSEPPIVYLDGDSNDIGQEFSPGHSAELKIHPLPSDCWIHLFTITAKGEFAYNQSVEINEAYDGDGWSITPEEPPWTFKIEEVSLVRDQGDGFESILVVTTLKACELDIKELTGKRLIRELDEQVGEGQWNADSITYGFK